MEHHLSDALNAMGLDIKKVLNAAASAGRLIVNSHTTEFTVYEDSASRQKMVTSVPDGFIKWFCRSRGAYACCGSL
jgi:hypothetical protein